MSLIFLIWDATGVASTVSSSDEGDPKATAALSEIRRHITVFRTLLLIALYLSVFAVITFSIKAIGWMVNISYYDGLFVVLEAIWWLAISIGGISVRLAAHFWLLKKYHQSHRR